MIRALGLELRHALRALRRSPGFTAAATLTLGLAIGANTALFSVVYGVLLRPLPYRDAASLVLFPAARVYVGQRRPVPTNFSLSDLGAWRQGTPSLQSIAMFAATAMIATTDQGSEPIPGAFVTASFFQVAGGRMHAGRPLDSGDDDAPRIVVSERLWRTTLAASNDLHGRAVILDGEPFTVVGVADRTFQLPTPAVDVWMPAGYARSRRPLLAMPGARGFRPIGRLAAGASLERAQAEANAVVRGLSAANPTQYGEMRVAAAGLRDAIVGDVRPVLLIAFSAVALVLLVACANTANLLLARNVVRSREIAVRAALGASRARLLAASLLETALLVSGSAVLGIAVAAAVVAILAWLQPAGLPQLDAVRVDLPVLAFAIGLASVTVAAAGILPAVAARHAGDALRQGAQTIAGSTATVRARRVLALAQIAGALVLVVGAMLLARSLHLLLHTDIGIVSSGVAAARVDLGKSGASSEAQQIRLTQRIVERVAALPGVQITAAATSFPPNRSGARFTLNHTDAGTGQPISHMVDAIAATPELFTALRVPLVKGRLFTGADDAAHQPVAIMTADAARQFFGDDEAVGRTLQLPTSHGNADVTIVGIVGAVKYSGLDSPAAGAVYRPFAQQGWSSVFVLARTDRDPAPLLPLLRRAIASVDAAIAVDSVQTLDQAIGSEASRPLFRAAVLAAFAALAIAIAAAGVYGVISYSVTRRTKEIGVRLALGAGRDDVLRLVLREGAILAAGGVVLGVATALAVSRTLDGLLYGVGPADPVSFAAAAAGVAVATLLASYVPARRATRVDPIAALRTE